MMNFGRLLPSYFSGFPRLKKISAGNPEISNRALISGYLLPSILARKYLGTESKSY